MDGETCVCPGVGLGELNGYGESEIMSGELLVSA